MWSYLIAIAVVGWLVYLGSKPTRRGQTAEDRGVEGEAIVEARLSKILSRICGNDFILRHSVILNIAPGTKYPTGEIDHLVITPFGVFVIETKAWRGQIRPGKNEDSLSLVSPGGLTATRKNPLAQNRSKVAFIQSLFPSEVSVGGAGVFSSPSARLSTDLSSNLIHVDRLADWLSRQLDLYRVRAIETSIPEFLDVARIDREIMRFADTFPDAVARHKARVTTT
jgi:Nuclease-related domain